MTKISKDVSLYYALLCVENNKQCLILGIKNRYYDSNDNMWVRLFSKKGRVKDKLKGDLINLNYSGFFEFKFILSTRKNCVHFNIECVNGEKKNDDNNNWILLHKDKYYYIIDTDNDCYLNSKIHCMVINPLQYTKYALVLSNNDNIENCLKYYRGINKIIKQNNNEKNLVKKYVFLFEKDMKIYPYVFKKCKICYDSVQGTECCECSEHSENYSCENTFVSCENTFIPCDTNIKINIIDANCNLYKIIVMAKYSGSDGSFDNVDMKKITYYTIKGSIKEICKKEYLCPDILIKDILFSIDINTIKVKILLNNSVDNSKINLSYCNILISD